MILSTKATINRRESNISIKKIWVLQWANIRQITADTRRSIIFWDIKKVQSKRKAENGWEGGWEEQQIGMKSGY